MKKINLLILFTLSFCIHSFGQNIQYSQIIGRWEDIRKSAEIDYPTTLIFADSSHGTWGRGKAVLTKFVYSILDTDKGLILLHFDSISDYNTGSQESIIKISGYDSLQMFWPENPEKPMTWNNMKISPIEIFIRAKMENTGTFIHNEQSLIK